METLLPVFAGLAVVPAIIGIRVYHARLLRRGNVRTANRRPLVPLAVLLVGMLVFFWFINAGMTNVLTVDVLSPDVPQVHVWVGDDRKTDGHRIAGY